MKALTTWIKQILCSHVWDYERLLESAEAFVVQTRCLRCGKKDRAARSVPKPKIEHSEPQRIFTRVSS